MSLLGDDKQEKQMFEWHVKYSETKKEGTRISCSMGGATIYADSEEEARQIMAEEMPDSTIDSLTKGDEIADD